MGSNLMICYEGIQRVYRNAVVRYLRQRITAEFPESYEDKVRAPFEKEWDKIRLNAQERRQTGEISSAILDDFDLLSVNHFFNLFDAYYEKLCPPLVGSGDPQQKLSKQTVLQWIKTIKNLRDPLSHPSEQDFSYEDSFVLLDCARRVLLRLSLGNEAKQLKALLDDLSGRPLSMEGTHEPLEGRLPPRESVVTDFIGRKTELDRLWEWFKDPVSRRWALAGEGGKGKSAIAYQFAADVMFSAPEPYQIVFWLSAKRQKFDEGVTQKIAEPDFHDVDSALRANILETVLVPLINEQGEKEKGRYEFSWCCSFSWGFGCRGTERRRAKRAAAQCSGSQSGRRCGHSRTAGPRSSCQTKAADLHR